MRSGASLTWVREVEVPEVHLDQSSGRRVKRGLDEAEKLAGIGRRPAFVSTTLSAQRSTPQIKHAQQ